MMIVRRVGGEATRSGRTTMAVQLDLSPDDLRFLLDHLGRYIAALDDELVHSDSRKIQHDLAADLERLRGLRDHLGTAGR
jgi:hypothetical protein